MKGRSVEIKLLSIYENISVLVLTNQQQISRLLVCRIEKKNCVTLR